MRALLIENDPEIQSVLETALIDFKDRDKALDRASALELLDRSLAVNRLFDVVVVDLQTAGMEDGSIIAEIRQLEKHHQIPKERKAFLIVISASPGRQLLTDCMVKGCDEFIEKPIDPDQILEKLTHLNLSAVPQPPQRSLLNRITGKALSDSVLKCIDRGDLELPPAPKIAMRTRQLVDFNADIEDVIDLLKHDLSISTKLIRMSNSVAYGGFKKNTSTSQAVRRLGIDRSVEVVMSICCRSYFVTNHPDYKQLVDDLWWHSLACAHAAAMVANQKKTDIEEDLFALGLLHDIGKLILIQAASVLQIPKKDGMEIDPEVLRSIVTDYHGRIGIRILRKWGYSKAFAALIQHHRVNGSGDAPAAMQALHEADLLAIVAGFDYGTHNVSEAAEQLNQSGYTARIQDDFKARIHSQLEQLRYTFG